MMRPKSPAPAIATRFSAAAFPVADEELLEPVAVAVPVVLPSLKLELPVEEAEAPVIIVSDTPTVI